MVIHIFFSGLVFECFVSLQTTTLELGSRVKIDRWGHIGEAFSLSGEQCGEFVGDHRLGSTNSGGYKTIFDIPLDIDTCSVWSD